MIFIKAESEIEKQLCSQFLIKVGILYHEDVFFSYKKEGNKNLIVFEILDKNRNEIIQKKKLIIDSPIMSYLLENFSLKKEAQFKKDNFGRSVKESNSVMHKEPLIDREIIEIRQKVVNFLKSYDLDFSEDFYPKKHTVCLTHDVDSLKGKSFLRYLAWLLTSVFNGNFLINLKKIFQFINLKYDPHDSIDYLINLEKKYGFKSTFFFLSLPFFISHEGRRYRLKKNKIKKLLKTIINKDMEIGLHTSRKGFRKSNYLKKEMERIVSVIGSNNLHGVRNHYLSGSFPNVWQTYENTGLKYDSSLGWSDKMGYRAETSNPFFPIDLNTKKLFSIVEVPLIVMDCAIEEKNKNEILSDLIPFFDIARRQNSLITILWHTDRINNPEYASHSKAYKLILDQLKNFGFQSQTMDEVVSGFKKHYEVLKKNQAYENNI